MADERYTTVARPKDYWMSPKALSITLNALEEANRIAASVTGGSQFFCHFEDVGDLQVEELFGYDVGHNFRSWPIAISPTWFNTSQRIYIHIAIPRRDRSDAQALLVFPTQRLDLWGYATYSEPMTDDEGNLIDEYGNVVDDPSEAATAYVRKKKSEYSDEDADPVGSQDYYYIYLHGQLTEPYHNGTRYVRDWDPEIDTGRLNTDETWGEVITIEQLAREMKKKVDVEWFQRIFTIHGTDRKRVVDYYDENGDPVYATDPETGEYIWDGLGDERDIRPNDMDHEITDTESMFGTWTQQWLSALGMGSGSGSGGGGGDALLQPLLSINQMEAMPTAVGQTLVWRGTGQGINGSGWDFGTAGMDGTELATWLFNNNYKPQGDLDLRYLHLTSDTPQVVVSDIDMTGNLTIARTTPISDFDAISDSLVLNFGETRSYFADKYVTVEFFESLFKVYNGTATSANQIATNGTIPSPSANVNIKAMFGFWTEQYLSALGQGSGGSGGGGGDALLQPLLSINTMEALPTAAGQTLVWRGTGQGINGSGWAFGTAGLDASAMDSRMRTNYSWWGQHMNAANEVTGDITVGIGDIILNNERKIRWKKSTGDTSYSMLTIDGSNNFIVGEAATSANNIDTYVRGQSINFQVGTGGTVDASLTQPATGDTTPVFYVKKLKIGSITISEDTQNGGLHVENAGLYADTFLSALGAGSQGGSGGMDLDAMWNALETNDSSHKIHNSHLNFNINNYALRSEIPSLSGYATESWVSSHFNNYEHPTGGANTTITAEATKVLASITVNSLGHVTAVGSKTLAAADIPSLDWGKITTGKPTTLSGYGITDAFTKTEVNGFKWWGRSLSNGVVTGNMTDVGSISMSSTISGCTSIDSLLYFDTTNGGVGIGVSSVAEWNRTFKLRVNGNMQVTHVETTSFGGEKTDTWTEPSSVSPATSRLWYGYDRYVPEGSDTSHNNQWHTTFSDYFGMVFHTAQGWLCMTQGGNVGIGTTAPTVKLDVAGRVRAEGIDFIGLNDTASTPHHHGGYLDFHYQESSADYTTRIIESGNGVLTIKKSSGATGIIVGGTAAANADYIKIGGATITWDNTNQALHIDKGVYSDSYVSALGTGSSGGSGGGINLSDVWTALASNDSSHKIHASHFNFNTGFSSMAYADAGDYVLANEAVLKIMVNGQTYKPGAQGVVDLGTISGGGSTYTLPAATSGALGGIKIGFTKDTTNQKYPVELSSQQEAFVQVPWANDDTKNTVGINTIGNSSSTIYLVGTKIAPNSTTGSDYATSFESSTCYIKSNYLYSNGSQVLTKSSGLGDLSNVTLGTLSNGQVLKYNGTNWINSSDSDEKVKVENGDPTSSTQYFLTFYTSVPSSGETGSLKVNTGLKYFTIKNSSTGAAILELGNYVSSSSLAAQRKIGQLRLLHRSHGFWGTLEIADSLTANQTYTLPSAGGTIATTGNVVTLTGNQAISGTKTFNDKISLGGTTNQTCKLYVNGNTLANGNLTVGQTTMNTGSKLYVSGKATITGDFYAATDFMIRKVTNPDNSYYYTIGINQKTVSAQGTWQGTFTSGSDIRQKDVIQNREISLEDIARTPIFEFTWKDKRDTKIHLGTSAQYWDSLLPSVVYGQQENSLSMDYGATALAAAVMTARTVLTHDEEIARLKKRIGELEHEIEILKAA